MPPKLSAVIITKNEADRIEACLQSLTPVTDDIVVIDSGSKDGTQALAKKLGARVIPSDWKGYGPTKNHGHSLAKYDWILSIDADEQLSASLITEIQKLDLTDGLVYAIDRQNYYLGHRIRHSGWSPDWVLRIFHKKHVKWNDSLVHEKLIVPPDHSILKLNHKLIHHSYRSKKDHLEKVEKYALLRAKSWLEDQSEPNVWKRNFGPFFKAFSAYILKLGFLDGKAGWEIASINAHLIRRQLYYYDQLKKAQS